MENAIAAVVVTYNRKELLQKCLDSILAQQQISCDVIVVDNASTDGTREMVENTFVVDRIKYFNTGSNLGGAGGFQYGIKKAVLSGYEYVWIMDDDTFPNESALYELMEADKKLNGNWGFLSSAAYWTDGNVCKANRQKTSIFTFVHDSDFQENIPVTIIMGSFVSLFVKSDVIKAVGLPIGEYFIWTDDYEFCGRISKKYPCYMVPKSKVVHLMKNHAKANIAIDSIERAERYFCLFRNDVHCYKQHGLKGWMYIVLKDIYTIFNILKKSKERKSDRIKVVMKGFKEGVRFRPQIEFINMVCINQNGGYNCVNK